MSMANWHFEQVAPREWAWGYVDVRTRRVVRSAVRFHTLLECIRDARGHGYDREHAATAPRVVGMTLR